MTELEISKLDKEALLSEKTIALILEEKDDLLRARLRVAAEDQAKQYGCKKAFSDLYKVAEGIVRGRPKNGSDRARSLTITEAVEVLSTDPALQAIKYNDMTGSLWVRGSPPWRCDESNYRPWVNIDYDFCLRYIEKNHGPISPEKLRTALMTVAYERRFNPVTELLDQLASYWDGQEGHIARLLPDFLGAEASDLTTEATKLVMLGAIKRAFNPGCKFDLCLVLVGPQGCGKSTLVRLLALDDDFFTDTAIDLNSERPAENIIGRWFVEFSELLSLRRARESESVKAFLTRTSDRMRLPYERIPEDFPRRCVFIGTTNDTDFLTDKTGNRRFLPIEVSGKGIKDIFSPDIAMPEIRQAWGEAMSIYQSGEYTLTMPERLLEEAEAKRTRFTVEDPDKVRIEAYLDRHPEIAVVCSSELFYNALDHYSTDRMTMLEARNINQIMSNLPGWKKTERKKRFRNYGIMYGYERTGVDNEADSWSFLDELPEKSLPF